MYYGAYAFVGMLLYAIDLYADFTGGIDITIGVAQMFGITLPENFRRPFFSKEHCGVLEKMAYYVVCMV